MFVCAPLGWFSSVLVYLRKLEVFAVTKVPFLFQSPRSRRVLLLLQRSELALCSPDFGASCCSSDTTEGMSTCAWVAESAWSTDLRDGKAGRGMHNVRKYLTLQMGTHKGFPGGTGSAEVGRVWSRSPCRARRSWAQGAEDATCPGGGSVKPRRL